MTGRNALIIDSSEIIRTGIGIILQKHSFRNEMMDAIDISVIRNYIQENFPDIIVLNPALCLNNSCEKIRALRQESTGNSKIVALVYAYFDEEILSLFDGTIYINDDEGKVMDKVNKLLNPIGEISGSKENASLSPREIEVIKLVSLGYSNKEIADELCISTHTVISHRKNITAKLGIKSASGLTIYAVINKLISTGDFRNSI